MWKTLDLIEFMFNPLKELKDSIWDSNCKLNSMLYELEEVDMIEISGLVFGVSWLEYFIVY